MKIKKQSRNQRLQAILEQFSKQNFNITSRVHHRLRSKIGTTEGTSMCENTIFDQPTTGVGSGTLTYMKSDDEDDDGVPETTQLL